jgi:hypothetical protein
VAQSASAAEWFGDPMHVPVEAIPQLIGQLEQLKAVLWTRLAAVGAAGEPRRSETEERGELLTVAQAAELLGVSARWLYRHAKTLPFARRLSRKALRFWEPGLRLWVTSHYPSCGPSEAR